MPELKSLKSPLLVYASQTGRSERLIRAAAQGITQSGEAGCPRVMRALQAGIEDLLQASALILATPENFGYMTGAMKDFLDRSYEPAQGRTLGLPYLLLVSAGNDGAGAVRSVQRIATGFGWARIAEPLIHIGEPDAAVLQICRERGEALAAGLALGIY